MSPDPLHPTGEDLFAYRDGELPPDRRSLVEAHVIGCSQCSARLEAMSEAEGALRARPDDVDDAYFEGMTASVMERIGARAPAPGATREAAPGATREEAPGAAREKVPDAAGEAPRHVAPVERRRPEPSPDEAPRRSKAGSWLGITGAVAAAAAVVVVVALLARHQGDWVRAPRPAVLGEPRSRETAPGANEAGRKDEAERRDEAVRNVPAPAAGQPPAKVATPGSGETGAISSGAARAVPPVAQTAPSEAETPAAPERGNEASALEQKALMAPSPLVKTQSAADAIGAAGAGPAPSGQDYQRIVREHGLPTTWDATVGREALLGAEAPLRALYMSGRAGSDSARIRLYLAEAERLTLASPSDSAGVDRILHHYWRAIRLAADDAALSALARRRLFDFQREVGERP